MILRLLGVGIVIALNNFAVSLALGAIDARPRWRIVLVFGAFEFALPLVGLLLGQALAGQLGETLGWFVPVLLAALAALTIWESFRGAADDARLSRMVAGWGSLILLELGLGVDDLLVGFGLGLAGIAPLEIAGTIGACAVALTMIGLWIGGTSRRHWEKRAEFVSGIGLLAVALAVWQDWI